ncbi:MAG: biotin/lipoyl-binding protein [Candidatus Faecousia sp.]|nr:biotin/lipoyl-binding protein [Candidatus Faecousia sp.]
MKKLNFKLEGRKKKILLSATAGVLAVAVIAGAVIGLRGRGDPVGVYPFAMVGMTEFWGDNQESYGSVTTDKIQTVFLSDTQTVTEVLVKQGDQVKKGDVLMTYDTTLSELELERKRLDVEKAKLQVKEAEEELQRINSLTPMSDSGSNYPVVKEEWGREIDEKGYEVFPKQQYDGSSPEKALVCWVRDSRPLDNSLLKYLYATAVDFQLKNAKESGSSASAIPEENAGEQEIQPGGEETQPERVETLPTEETTLPEEETQPEENHSGGANQSQQVDPYQEEIDRFRETAPASLRISSRSVGRDGTFPVRRGSAANLFFTTNITDPVHSKYVKWEVAPAVGSLQGMANGYGSYTLSGIPAETGDTEYTVTARYEVDGVARLLDSYHFTLSVQETVEEQQPANSFYMILRVTQDNKQYAPKTVWQGIHVTAYDGGGFGFQLFDTGMEDPLLPESQDDPYSDIDFGSGMTAAEIAKLRREQEKKIKDLTADAKMTESEYNLMEREFNDGNIRATLDGEVVSLLTEEESRDNRQPMMKVSGGGGFYVEGSVSELEKDNLRIGQEVTINDWNTGATYTGEVRSIGDFPTGDNGWNGMGNPNASYYPFQVFIDGSADLQEGSYVSMTYSAAEAENGIYLENPFLRTDDGEPYVYVRGDNGRLEKRMVTTGKSLWGSYTEIRSGLTEDDYIAFPYGKTVKPGAATEESDLSALYGY